MRVPKESECVIVIRAATKLLEIGKNITLYFSLGGRGGVPEWPVSLWEQFKESR